MMATPLHVLWLKTELLHPLDKGGRIRTYHMLRRLRQRNRVTYLALDDGTSSSEAVQLASEYCDDLVRIPFAPPSRGTPAFYLDVAKNVWSALPYAIARYRSPSMRREIERAVQAGRPQLIVCDFLVPAVNLPAMSAAPTLLFEHNVEAAIWDRHARVARRWWARRYFAEQARRMQAFEGATCRRVDTVVAVSDVDGEAIRSRYGVEQVSVVGTGVDVQYFRPSTTAVASPVEIVFIGSMDWMPNEDGILWFVTEILPLIRRTVPEATLSIVGRNPTARVAALAQASGIHVTGTVADIRPYLERAAVVVVPLRVGGGTRLKIFEAMAMERPIVSTAIGAEGLPVVHGEHCLLADSPEAFAAATAALLLDHAQAEGLARRAAELVRREFGWDTAAAQFADICAQTVGHRGAVPLPSPA